MTAVFLSDVHLQDASSVKSKIVIRFLQEQASRFESIFIMGDFFDVWPATSPYLIEKFEPVLSVLRNLVKCGHRVHYFEGNHDFHLGEYFSNEIGIQVYPGPSSVEWAGKKIYLAHGDLGNPKEFGYRVLRYVLRRPITKFLIQKTPQKWVYDLGKRGSTMSRDYQMKSKKREAAIREIYRSSARRILESGYDIVLMGHTHIPDDFTIDLGSKSGRYINTGDWVKHFSYVEFDGQEFYTRTHPVKSL
ncbi:MAG: UDP-2,3-diacylglucosamine diphosphatase [Bdellovibrionaceae bacterium]|nr:UDP-2,3-diacylglucosamine diphosphatase [Bdellovibrionales bacterium]MCB9253473.1 UDP-2,3-diacylglucosamine diphosphatase [Pseudobdellovibrionaceae bacterium]